MACPNNYIFFICVIVFSFAFSDTVYDKNEDSLNDVKNKEEALNERRKAMDYISTLSTNPKTWVDPYDMGLPAKEELLETTDESPDMNYPILEADDQPLFSDINGNVIVEKVPMTPSHRNPINDLDPGGFFQKDQQPICVLDSIYISRWLKKLVFKIENESDLEASAVSFQLDSVILNTLKEISDAKSLKITELDILMCDLLSQMVVTRMESYDWKTVRGCCTHALLVIVYDMSILFVIYGLHFFFKRHPKLMLFFCGLVVFVLWHWMYLYEHIKVYNHAELSSTHIPDECQKHNFKLFEHVQDYIVSYFINNECDKYFVIDPFFEVSFNVTVLEAIKVILFLPFSTSSQFDCDLTKIHDSWLIYILLFLVMLTFLFIMFYLYGMKQFLRGAFLLICKIFKTPQSTCIKTTLKQDSDASPSDSLRGPSFNSNRFSNDTDSIQGNVPESVSGPEFFCDSCDAHDQSGSEDNNSSTYSNNTSWSDNSFDSEDCPCCIHDSELIQELHVGCRVCDNNNAATGSAGTSRDESESLFKNESDDFTDEQRNQRLEEVAHASGENAPQPIIDPSAA